MRLRHIPGSEEAVLNSPFVISDPENKKGRWKKVFGNENPIEIEVGMGKGRFIMDMAALHPEVNFIGIERYSSVLLRGLEKRELTELNNLYFLCEDAKNLSQLFARGEVNKVYLNFSDPWPKDRHARRRLTSPVFMKEYGKILIPDGVVEFKTDNRGLFDYSMEAIPAAGFRILNFTYDLHHDPLGENNVMTEYEEKFSSKGNPICKLIAGR